MMDSMVITLLAEMSSSILFEKTCNHGPINTWDRQRFLTGAVQFGLPSLWQHVSWTQNICVLYQSSAPYNIENCDVASLLLPYLANNTI